MNFETLEADIDLIMNTHFTPGRDGHNINKVVLHHNGGNLTVQGCYDTWQNREASAHYQVQGDGLIGQLVWDRDTAWHTGEWVSNCTSIGIEHANNNMSNFTISDACLNSGAHLVAGICKYFNLGAPAWMVNVFPHQYFTPTACPGAIAGSQNAAYMERALYWYNVMTGQTVKPATPKQELLSNSQLDQLARDVIAGKYGNGSARKTALGSNYDAVQNRVNELLLGSSQKRNIDEVARDVIAGKYGNQPERAQRLAAAGYSYSAVQNRVNQILLG